FTNLFIVFKRTLFILLLKTYYKSIAKLKREADFLSSLAKKDKALCLRKVDCLLRHFPPCCRHRSSYRRRNSKYLVVYPVKNNLRFLFFYQASPGCRLLSPC